MSLDSEDDERIPGAGDEPDARGSRGSVPPRPSEIWEEEEAGAGDPDERFDCLIAGPVSTGKTRYLSKLGLACNTLVPGEPEMLFSHTDSITALIQTSRDLDRKKKGLGATGRTQTYDFSIEVNIHSGKKNRPPQHLGTKTFRCMDGPGGALFYDDPSNPNQDPAMREFRRELVRCGKAAASLVFFVDPLSEINSALVTRNLAQLFGELAIRYKMPAVAPPAPKGSWTDIFDSDRNRPRPVPNPAPRPQYAWKLTADRVLFIFNRIDQLAAAWQRSNQVDRRLTAYQIAQHMVKPGDLALQVLGTPFLQQVRAFLKPGAVLAAAVCTAGGFVEGLGIPYLDDKGIVNRLDSVSPAVMERHLKLYGVRETMLFAGFGHITPNLVEEITRETLLKATAQPA